VWTIFDSPIGVLTIQGDEHAVTSLSFPGRARPPAGERNDDAFAFVTAQLAEYFAGERRFFEVPVELHGTEFQMDVWERVRMIPFGETISYGDIAKAIGAGPDRIRAVGGAVGSVPVPIIVPCHRVIGADGSLTGYGGGLDRKRHLLDLEQGRLALL
jgi:methylated-DNA-[protein]-cysteine S-methyltransferase